MIQEIGIIGDVHGNAYALAGLLRSVEGRFGRLVFVGDYVNRGPDSASVIQMLIDQAKMGTDLYCIAGNHDRMFLKCLDDGELTAFLRIGGASAISSYIGTPQADVLKQLRDCVPEPHVEFLQELKPFYRDDELLVTHSPSDVVEHDTINTFHVFGHVPQASRAPRITERWAAIDTGCGSLPEGRLTCLAWPTREVIQVDSVGRAFGVSG